MYNFNKLINSKKIQFEESYHSDEYNSITLYFIAKKKLFKDSDIFDSDEFNDADSIEISIELPDNCLEPAFASTTISLTKDGCDYDWLEITMPDKVIGYLIDLYLYLNLNKEGNK